MAKPITTKLLTSRIPAARPALSSLALTIAIFSATSAAYADQRATDISQHLLELCRNPMVTEQRLQRTLEQNGWKPTEIDQETAVGLGTNQTSPTSLAFLFWFSQEMIGNKETVETVSQKKVVYAERMKFRDFDIATRGFAKERFTALTNGQALFSYEFYPRENPWSVQCYFSGVSNIAFSSDRPGLTRVFEGENISRYRVGEPFPIEDAYRITGEYASTIFDVDFETLVFFRVRNRLGQ